MKPIIHLAFALLILPVHVSRAGEDPRFASGNLGVENSYLEGIAEVAMKAFGRSGWSLRGLEGVNKVGETYVVSGFVTLDEIQEPVTEKDFERISGFFEPFLQGQIDLYEKKGLAVRSRHNGFPLPDYAKGYTKNAIPRMTYILSGEKTDLFLLDLTFSEREDNHLVIGFTIAAVP